MRFSIIVTGLAGLFGLCSCTTPVKLDYEKIPPGLAIPKLADHVLSMDDEGRLCAPQYEHEPLTENQQKEYIAHIVRQALEHAPVDGNHTRRILIHIHGGLNARRSALDAVTERLPKILYDYPAGEACYPIFINWECGLPSSYAAHLLRHRQGLYYDNGPTVVLAPFVLGASIGRAITRWPFTIAERVLASGRHQDSILFENRGMALRAEGAHQRAVAEAPELRLTLTSAICNDKRPESLRQFRNVNYAGTFWLKGLTLPVVDGLGTGAWDVMLARAQWLFEAPVSGNYDRYTARGDAEAIATWKNSPEKFRITEMPESSLDFFSDRTDGVVLHFLKELSCAIGKEPAGNVTINLIGHSMGAIVANEILRHCRELNLPVTNIVHMGSADTIARTEEIVLPYLRANQKTTYYNLTLHPYQEVLEAHAFELSPRGSLLEWIDSMFSNPVVFKQRTMGKWNNCILAWKGFRDYGGRVNFKMFEAQAPEGQTTPQMHKEFTHFLFWRKDYWEPTVQPAPPKSFQKAL